MTLVFRLESECGNGPFQKIQDSLILGRFLWANYKDTHISPECDPPLFDWCWMEDEDKFKYYFGFIDLSQFRQWFNEEDCSQIKHFEDNKFNYEISVYQLDDVDIIKGDHQLVFNRDRSVLVARIDCEDLNDPENDLNLINDSIRSFKNNER